MPDDDLYIWVNRWDEFQTFQKKKGKPWVPPWIKVYPSLLDEPAYTDLTPETRSLLEGIWKLFARTRGTLRKDTRNLSRQLSQRVTEPQLERLNHAGWISFCSGTVLEQRRNSFWNRSTPDVEEEEEEEPKAVTSTYTPPAPTGETNGPGSSTRKEQDHDDDEPHVQLTQRVTDAIRSL